MIAVVQLTAVGRTSLNEKLVGLLALKDAMVTVIGRRKCRWNGLVSWCKRRDELLRAWNGMGWLTPQAPTSISVLG